MPCRYSRQSGPGLFVADTSGSHGETFWTKQLAGRLTGGRGGYGRWGLYPVQRGLPHSCAQWGQSPVPQCQWEHMSLGQTNTSVSRPQSPHQSDHAAWRCYVITHHRLLGKGQEGQPDADAGPAAAISIVAGLCWKNRESEWEGRWGKDSPVWDREAGLPPPSCERLESVCASTSGWAGGVEKTDVRIGWARAKWAVKLHCWSPRPLQHVFVHHTCKNIVSVCV